jgi:hypothetical protein
MPGAKTGVAPQARVICIKMLSDRQAAPMGWVVDALDNVLGEKARRPNVPMIVSMSLGGPYNDAVNAAVEAAVQKGLLVGSIAATGDLFFFLPDCSPGTTWMTQEWETG